MARQCTLAVARQRAVPSSGLRRLGGDLFDVVHQAVQMPLCAHLGPASEREAAHALVMPDVRKRRLDGCIALAAQRSAIDRFAHAPARLKGIALPTLEGKQPHGFGDELRGIASDA